MTSASTCVRFCPLFFACSQSNSGSHSPAESNEETQPELRGEGERGAGDSGPAPSSDSRPPFRLGYKLVYAVGTTDSIFLYDTGEPAPELWHGM